jgi:hypothetical protein
MIHNLSNNVFDYKRHSHVQIVGSFEHSHHSFNLFKGRILIENPPFKKSSFTCDERSTSRGCHMAIEILAAVLLIQLKMTKYDNILLYTWHLASQFRNFSSPFSFIQTNSLCFNPFSLDAFEEFILSDLIITPAMAATLLHR